MKNAGRYLQFQLLVAIHPRAGEIFYQQGFVSIGDDMFDECLQNPSISG